MTFQPSQEKNRFREEYIKALIKEIKEKCTDYLIRTIFIGGGTPSHLEKKELEKLLKSVSKLNLLRGYRIYLWNVILEL